MCNVREEVIVIQEEREKASPSPQTYVILEEEVPYIDTIRRKPSPLESLIQCLWALDSKKSYLHLLIENMNKVFPVEAEEFIQAMRKMEPQASSDKSGFWQYEFYRSVYDNLNRLYWSSLCYSPCYIFCNADRRLQKHRSAIVAIQKKVAQHIKHAGLNTRQNRWEYAEGCWSKTKFLVKEILGFCGSDSGAGTEDLRFHQ